MKHLNRRAMVLKYGIPATLTTLVFSSSAFAALDEATLDAAVAGITTDANLAFSKAFPILTLVLGLVIGMTLFKRFIQKSAS